MRFGAQSVELVGFLFRIGLFETSLDVNFTSIDSENLNDADCLELYPNPVTDSFELACFPENGRVIVYDNNGKQLISSNHKTVNCTSLSDGTYLARVLTDKGRVIATIQFIVSKNR